MQLHDLCLCKGMLQLVFLWQVGCFHHNMAGPWVADGGAPPDMQGRFFIGVERTLYAYEDGTDRKFRNVGTKSSDAGRLPKKTQYSIQHTAKV